MLIIEDLTFESPVAVCDTMEQAEEIMKEYAAEIFRKYKNYGAEISVDYLSTKEFKDIFEYGLIGFEVYEIPYNKLTTETPTSYFFGHCKKDGRLFNAWAKEEE